MSGLSALVTSFLFVFSSSGFAANKFVCVNKTDLKSKFEVSITRTGATLSGATTACKTSFISYRPNSPKYKDWVRVAPVATENGCNDFNNEVVGKPYDGDTADIHWLSLSKEVQSGAEGFAQLGIQNTSDPGSGGTAKVFVRCYPK